MPTLRVFVRDIRVVGSTVFTPDELDRVTAPYVNRELSTEDLQALGYQLEKVRGVEPETMARASEGDARALAEVEALVVPKAGSNPRDAIQRPSMAQDILKGRRTEIDAMNGYIARKGVEVGVPAPSHARLAEIVTRIERGELKPSPSLVT